MNAGQRPLPIGKDNFQKLIESHCYYVDKTLLIKDLLDSGTEVALFTRPRRFGKTLNQSMIQFFFEKRTEDTSHLFQGLKISASGGNYMDHQGQYPVINLSFIMAKQPTFDLSFDSIKKLLANEYNRHAYLLDTIHLDSHKDRYSRIQNSVGEITDYTDAIRFLSECLFHYHKKNVIILIDEYDVPLENAYYHNFYSDMSAFIRTLFESALKTNEYLNFCVLTGCLRISRESIFTGLNNLEVNSITNDMYAERFGFTPHEAVQLLNYYNLGECQKLLTDWYNGYVFGNTEIYNPWSVIQFIKDLRVNKNALPSPYWSNTSSNSIVKDLIDYADDATRDELSALMAGQPLEKPIHEDVTYDTIYNSKDNLWNFLYFTGYLTKVSEQMQDDVILMKLRIPNKEVKSVYNRIITSWFDTKRNQLALDGLKDALETANTQKIEQIITQVLTLSISSFDYNETFYHGLMIGLLTNIDGYYITSNREAGNGRLDVQMKSRLYWNTSFIFEFKLASSFSDMKERAEDALSQIEAKHYDTLLKSEGRMKILKYGIAFYKKECKVLCNTEPQD